MTRGLLFFILVIGAVWLIIDHIAPDGKKRIDAFVKGVIGV